MKGEIKEIRCPRGREKKGLVPREGEAVRGNTKEGGMR